VDTRSPEELAFDLQTQSVELDVLSLPGVVKRLSGNDRNGRKIDSLIYSAAEELPDLSSRHGDLAGLPFRRGDDCRKSASDARLLQHNATRLHCVIDPFQSGANLRRIAESPEQDFRAAFEPQNVNELRNTRVGSLLTADPNLRQPTAVPILVQMLQPFDVSIRADLIGGLAAIDSTVASAALAERAIYDLSPQIRDAARNELRHRPARDYQGVLVAGLRYPWAPVAMHAAQTIVALNLQDAFSDLNRMVDLPNPSVPHQDESGRWVATELVRINHLRNCYLCHAPSKSPVDSIRGSVPTPGERVRPVYSRDDHEGFIRADVTYLKQDFSVTQEMANADPWPKLQRFDYLVRTRDATLAEIALANAPEAIEEQKQDYPQRAAVMYALQGLLENAGRDAATSHDNATAESASRMNSNSPHDRR
jgi:hypothetical protein